MKRFFEYSGYFVGLIGLILSIYFYEVSKKEKDPTFILEPIRTEIVNSERLSNSPIRIFKSNNQEIKANLTSIRFYFWNKGNDAIKKENILSDIVIKTEPSTKIIFSKIIKQARNINKITLTPIDSNTLKLDFNILEIEDGFTGEIFVEGNSKSNVSIHGDIEGVRSFSYFPVSLYRVLSKTFLYFICGIILLGISLLTTGGRGSYDPDHIAWQSDEKYTNDDNFKNRVDELEIKYNEYTKLRDDISELRNPESKKKTEADKIKANKRLRFFLITLGTLIVLGALTFSWYKVNEEIKDNPSNFIPTSIKP